MRHVVLWLTGWLCPQLVFAMSVVFINPGKSDEVYWVSAARAMEAAAKSLGVSLQVMYAERDHPKAIEIARTIAARTPALRRRWQPTGKVKSKKVKVKGKRQDRFSPILPFYFLVFNLGQTPGIAFLSGFKIANNTTAINSAMQASVRKKLDCSQMSQ